MRTELTLAVFGLILALSSVDLALGQRTTANIYGTVQDATRAAVPRATIKLTNELTGAVIEVTTNEIGEFSATFIPVGTYTLIAEAKGFRTMRQTGLELTSGQQIRYPITLEVGEVTEQIEVSAAAPLLQSASSELSGRLDTTQIEDLPSSRRDFTQLLTLQNGVVRTSTEMVTINGLPGAGISVTLDGVDASGDTETPSLSNFQGQNFINVISREAIQEVNVSKGVMSAEIGRTLSGNINVISKGGTNQLHGSAFYNWQNDILNARYALLSPSANKPPIRFNQFGGSLGGPIVRDKLFYFFTYEGYRQSNFAVVNSNVPTPEFRARAIAAMPAYADGFKQFPDPNQPYTTGADIGFWRGAAYDKANDDHFLARGDYQFRDADRLSMRYTHGSPYHIIPTALITNQRVYEYGNDSGNLTWSHASAQWTSETRFGVNYTETQRLDQSYAAGLPGFEVQGNFGFGGELQQLTGSTYSVEEIVATNIGRHTLKFGGLIHRASPGRFDEEVPGFRYGNPGAMVSNTPNRVRFTFGIPKYRGTTWNYAGFIQDDFKVRPNLTLNLGLRYEYYSVFEDPEGRVFTPGTLANLYAIPTVFRPQDQIYNPDWNNFLPRVGLVWSPDQKTVVRTGAGIAVAPQNLRHFYTNVRYSPEIGFRYTLQGAELGALGLKYPITNDQGKALVESGAFLQSYLVFDEDNPNPESYQWTFDIQRELTSSTVARVGYVGTRGLKLTLTQDVNRPDRVTGISPAPYLLQSLYRDASDSSTYHALELSLRQRFARDITFNAYYTWSKTLAIGTGDFWGGNELAPQDENNYSSNWGPVPHDQAHRFSLDFIWDAPFARWAGASRAVEQVLGGWQFAGVFRAASGRALLIEQSSGYDSSRPDYIGGDPYANSSDRYVWLNTAAFVRVPEGKGGPLRPGNLGKGALRGPDAWNFDLSISKAFRFTERHNLRFGFDMFNAFNHVILRDPVADITNGNFGRITSVDPARTMQLSGRFTF